MRDRLLLHVCCAPCAAWPLVLLRDRFDLTLLFYGPNIHPKEEYNRRLESTRYMAGVIGVPLAELGYTTDKWYDEVRGLEDEPEGGKRCSICYRIRLEQTAGFAKENGYKYFGTTLTLSPHKPAGIINPIGESIAKNYGLSFLSEDFKKENGFKKSCEMSKKYGLYRQGYCGCEFASKRVSGLAGSRNPHTR